MAYDRGECLTSIGVKVIGEDQEERTIVLSSGY